MNIYLKLLLFGVSPLFISVPWYIITLFFIKRAKEKGKPSKAIDRKDRAIYAIQCNILISMFIVLPLGIIIYEKIEYYYLSVVSILDIYTNFYKLTVYITIHVFFVLLYWFIRKIMKIYHESKK